MERIDSGTIARFVNALNGRGLAVHDAWDWSKRHPVVRLSFAGGNFRRPGELQASAMQQIAAAERRAGLPAFEVPTLAGGFSDLLEALHDRTGERIVVLVDEYDKQILNALEGPAPSGERGETPAAADAQATTNGDDLRGLYGTLKDCDAHVELSFITGVSKFSKVSIFSDLLDRLHERPGVDAVGVISNLHLHPFNTSSSDFNVAGFEPPTGHGAFIADRAEVDPGSFEAAGIEMLRGRNFNDGDRPDTQPAVIISEAMAQRFWTDGDAVGRLVPRRDDGPPLARRGRGERREGAHAR